MDKVVKWMEAHPEPVGWLKCTDSMTTTDYVVFGVFLFLAVVAGFIHYRRMKL